MLRLPHLPRLAAALAILVVLALPLRAQTVFTVDTTLPPAGILTFETIINAGVTVTGSEGGGVFADGTTINGTLIMPADFIWWVSSGSFSINHALHLNGGSLYTLDASINGGTATISSGTWNLNALNASGGTYVQTGGSVASSSSSFGLASITGGSLSTGLLALAGPTTFGAATITTTQIARANPAATLSINGTTIRAAAFQSSFFDGFAGSSVSLGAAGLTFDSNGLIARAPNIFTGTGGITKIGAGTLGLSGANTYTGATHVNAGTLWLSGTASLPASSALTVAPGASVTFGLGGVGDYTVTQALGVIAGSTFQSGSFYGFDTTHAAGGTATLAENLTVPLPLVKTGSGTLILTGDNTGTGAMTVAGGNLAAGHDSALGATGAPVTLASGGAFQPTTSFTSNRTFSFAGGAIDTPGGINFSLNTPFTGTGPFIKTGAGVLTLTVANTASAATIVSAGTLRPGAANFLSPTSAIYLNNGTLDLNGYNQTVPNLSSYNIATTVFDPGTVQLSGATLTNLNLLGDAWHGDVTGTGNYIFQGTGPYTWTGTNTFTGTLTIATGTLTAGATNTLSPNAAVSISSGATLALDNYSQSIASLTGAGTVSLGSATLTSAQSGNTTFSGPISGTGALTKAGTGTLTLSGNNTYTGGTTISAGTLALGSPTALPANRAVSLSTGATLDLANTPLSVSSLSGGGNIQLGSATLTVSNSAENTFAGVISGTGGLTKSNLGTLTLSGVHTYTGTTTIAAGTLTLAPGSLLAYSGNIVVLSGATLDLLSFDGNFAALPAISGPGAVITPTTNLVLGADNTSGAYGGILTGSSTLTKIGTGTFTITTALVHVGETSIATGTLRAGAANILSPHSAHTIAAGATLDLNNFANTLGSLAGAGDVSLGSATLTAAQNTDSTFAGVISGSGALTKAGTGTLTLSGNNSYAGPTAINAGTLQLGDGGPIGSSTSSFANSGSLVFNHSGDFSLSAPVTGTGSLTKLGTGTLTVMGPVAHTGATTVSAGTFQIGTTGSLTANITNHAAVAFDRADAHTYAGLISGPGSLVKLGTGTLSLTGNQTYTGPTTISAGTLQIGNGGTSGSLASPAISNSGTLAFNRSDAYTFAGTVSGTGGLTKAGAGTLTLSGSNTYTGTTTVSVGTLALGTANALPASTTLTVATGATFDLAGFAPSFGSIAGGGTVNLRSATLSLGADNNPATISTAFVGSGGLTKVGNGTLTLTGANTHTATTTISSGTLQIGAGGTTGSLAGDIANNATLTFNRSDTLTYAGNISGSGTLNKLTNGTVTLTGTNTATGPIVISAGTLQVGDGGTTGALASSSISNSGTLVFNRSDNVSFATPVSGTGSLTKLGTGTTTLSGNNTYTGTTTVAAGTLRTGAANTLGSASTLYLLGNATLDLNGFDLTVGNLDSYNTATGLFETGTVQLGGATVTNLNLVTNVWVGSLTGTGNYVKQGFSNLFWRGTNTFTGSLTLSAGTFYAESINTLSPNASVSVSSGASLVLQNYSQTIAGLSGSGSIAVGSATLTTTQTPDTTWAGVISGTGGLTKSGSGTLTLSGQNIYTGPTTITAGTLQIGTGSSGASLASASIANSGSLVFHHSDAVTIFGAISGPGSLTKLGSGTLVLAGATTHTGGTILSAGTLQIGAGDISGHLVGNIANSATVAFNRSDAHTYAGLISGSGSLTKLGAGTLTLTGDQTYTGSTTISAGTLQLGDGSTSGSLASPSIVNHATLVLNRSDDVTLPAAVSGAGSLVKLGAGTVTLTGAHTSTGTTTVSAGTLALGAANLLSPSAKLRLVNNATVALNGFNQTIGTLDSFNPTSNQFETGTLSLGGATLTNLNLLDSTWKGSLTGNGHYVFQGSAGTTWTGTNTFTGTLTVATSTLATGATHTLSPNASVILAGGVLNLGDKSQVIAGLSGQGTVQLNGATFTTTQSANTTLSGILSGTGNFTKSGNGTLTLSGANTLAGSTTVEAGTLAAGAAHTLSPNASVSVSSGATLALENHSQTIAGLSGAGSVSLGSANLTSAQPDNTAFSGTISGTGGLTKAGNGTLTLSGSNTYTGTTTVSAGTLRTGAANVLSSASTLYLLGNATLDLNGFNQTVANLDSYDAATGLFAPGTLILGGATLTNLNSVTNVWAGSLTGAGNYVKQGAGNLFWRGTNTFTGSLALSAGTFYAERVNTLSPNASVSVSSGATLVLQNYAQTIAGLSGSGSISLGSATLTTTQTPDTTWAGVISGTGGLTKSGSGTLTLSGQNTYTGATTIEAGTLDLGTGGTLVTSAITRGTSGSALFTGGTLRISADTPALLAGFTTGTAVLGSGGLTVDTNGYAVGLSPPLSGTGGLTKSGSGTLTLAGANTYSGNTSITAGTLALGVAESLPDSTTLSISSGATYALANFSDTLNGLTGAGSVSLGSGTLTFGAASGDGAFSGVISGTGGLTKAGLGTQFLTGANTYSGPTTVSAGTLHIGDGSTTGSLASSAITNHATLAFNRSDATTYAGVISGSGSLLKLGAGTLTLSGLNTYSGTTTISTGTLQIGDGNTTGSLATSAITNNATLVYNRSDNLALSAPISGTGTLVKNGAGTLTLSGAHAYTGATTVNAGTLALGAHFTIPDASPVVIATGATLDLNGFSDTVGSLAGAGSIALGTGTLISGADYTSTTFAGVLSGNGALLKLGTGTLTLSGTNTYTATTTVSAGTLQIGDGGTTGSLASSAITNHATLAFNRSDATTLSAVVSGTGSLVKLGTGTLTLSAGQLYSGNTTVSAGTLALGVAGAIPDSSTLTVASGATYALNNFSDTLNGLSGAGTVSLGSGNLIVGAASGDGSWSGVISGTGGLTKAGLGTQILSGANTYTGPTTINVGALQIGDGGTTGSLASPSIVNYATLAFNRSDASTYPGVISGTGSLLKLGSGTLTLTGANTYTAGTTVSAGTLQFGDGGTTGTLPGNITNHAVLAFNRSDALTSAGPISGTGSLLKLGTGTLTLSGANTYSGNTTISAGTLRLAAANALPSGTPLALATGATLDLNNHAASVGKLDGSGNIVLGSANLTVAQSSSSTFTGSISGTGGLTKSGPGLLTLVGTHTYSGATAITGGQLALTGSAASSAFSVNSGATLSGTGTLGALTVNSGGTVSPGASPGTLSTGATTFNSGGSLKWEINNATGLAGTNWDLLSISGSLTVASTSGNPFAINLTSLLANNTAGQVINFNSAQNYSYTIATASSGITGFSASAFTLDTSGFTNPLNGGSWSLAANGNNLNLNFTPSAIPEPSTYAAILGAAALLLAAAHRRKTRSRSS